MTPELKIAYEQLEQAINNVIAIEGMISEGMVNTNFLVLIEQTGWDGDGNRNTGLVRVYKDNELPWITMLGMLRAATLLAERDYTSDGTAL